MVIYFSAKASLGFDDFHHDMPHFCPAVLFLDITESRQIDSLSSSHQPLRRLAY
jgi:hypothetical protein